MANTRSTGSVDIGPHGPTGRSLHAKINRDLAKVVRHLIHQLYDLVGAYDLAIMRTENPEIHGSLAVLQAAHSTQIEQLADQLGGLGANPTHRGDAHAVVENARVLVARRKGDRGVLAAMAQNEQDMIAAYHAALARPGLPAQLRAAIDKAVSDEDGHRAFFDRALGRFVG